MKNIFIIVFIIIVIGVGYFAFVKKSDLMTEQLVPTPAQNDDLTKTPSSPISTPDNEVVNWQSHSNTEIGFSFKYPQTWKVEDGLKINNCCLNLFNSVNPYQGDLLKQGVMKAQFQYDADVSVSSKQAYIDSLIDSKFETGALISKSSIVSVQNENGLDVIKFTGGVGSIGYVIPKKQNFSEVIYVIVWNTDPAFEKVISTLKLTK